MILNLLAMQYKAILPNKDRVLKEAVLLSTHFVNDFVLDKYRKLCDELDNTVYDVILLYNVDDGNETSQRRQVPDDVKVFVTDKKSIRSLGYHPIEDTLLPGSCHFPLLRFYLDHPSYEFYWLVEYDVDFTGKWLVLMDDCRHHLRDYDFLSCHVERYNIDYNGHWTWWKRSNHLPYPLNQCIKSFNPISRYSSKALACLDKFQKQGYSAHSEVLIATCLLHSGLKIGDLGGEGEFVPNGYENKYYISYKGRVNAGTVRYRPEYTQEEIAQSRKRCKLFHPVKCHVPGYYQSVPQKNKRSLPDVESRRGEDALISVVMPMYNASAHLCECIDSILSQSYGIFELLIGDDGSTDNSVEIARSYHDSRIRLLAYPHDYIATCNHLLREAKGKYIARMDADDVMMPNRLQCQLAYMERNPQVDIMGAAIEILGEDSASCYYNVQGPITFVNLFNGCCMVHPTAFMRRDKIFGKKLRYRKQYIYAEDYDLWAQAVACGLCVVNTKDIVLKYRLSSGQTSCKRGKEQFKASIKIQRRLARMIVDQAREELSNAVPIPSRSELTVIIPFFNEGDEVRNTVRDIRNTAGDTVDIIVINDCSNDNYPYFRDLRPYHVHYIENAHRIGSACSKEKGVRCCTSKYFILLDAHMRFYQKDWSDILLQELHRNGSQILCCQTKALKKEGGKVVEKADTSMAYGAYINFDVNNYIPSAHWITSPSTEILESGEIPCVLGASYASSKCYWDKIRGLEGLLGYGCEEPYISIKSWLEGGKCKLLENIVVGHVFKTATVDFQMAPEYVYNYLFISKVLFPTSLESRSIAVAMKRDRRSFMKATMLLEASKEEIKILKRYYSSLRGITNFEEIIHANHIVPQHITLDNPELSHKIDHVLTFSERHCPGAPSYGLYDGKCCLMLLYGLLYKNGKVLRYLDEVYSFVEQIDEQDALDTLPLSFNNGIMGIGWTFMYLYELGVLAFDDIEPFLVKADSAVSMINPATVSSVDYLCQLSGYASSRLGFARRHHKTHGLGKELIRGLVVRSKDFVAGNHVDALNVRQLEIFLLMSRFNQRGWCTTFLDVRDVASLPVLVAEDEQYWTYGITGCTGYAINLLSTFVKASKI